MGGGRGGRSRRPYNYQSDDDDDEEDTSEDSEDSEEEALRAREDALVQSAMQRIRRAQARGRLDVKLSKDELKALDRRKKRMEAARNPRRSQRVAVPLAQLDPGAYMSMPSLPTAPEEDMGPIPQQHQYQHLPTPQDSPNSERQVYPPMGYFPPPQAPVGGPRSRPRSASTMSQMAAAHGGSPFQYSYVHPVQQRHVSDNVSQAGSRSASRARPASMMGHPPPPHEDSWNTTSSQSSNASSSRIHMDPFQYQTAGPRAHGYMGPQGGPAAAAARRHSSNPMDQAFYAQAQRRSMAPIPQGMPAGEEEETSEEETSDEEESDEDEEAHSDGREQAPQPQPNGMPSVSDKEIIVIEEGRTPRGSKPPSPAQRSPPVLVSQPGGYPVSPAQRSPPVPVPQPGGYPASPVYPPQPVPPQPPKSSKGSKKKKRTA